MWNTAACALRDTSRTSHAYGTVASRQRANLSTRVANGGPVLFQLLEILFAHCRRRSAAHYVSLYYLLC
jgi:hypothetical protein